MAAKAITVGLHQLVRHHGLVIPIVSLERGRDEVKLVQRGCMVVLERAGAEGSIIAGAEGSIMNRLRLFV